MDRDKFEYWFAALLNELTSGQPASVAIVNATRDMAQVFAIGPVRCEHDVIDGEWCEQCNREYKDAEKKGGDT